MNYIKLLAILFACTLFTAPLTSCGDDDENDNQTTSTNTGGSGQGGSGSTFDKSKLLGRWADMGSLIQYTDMLAAGESTSRAYQALGTVFEFSASSVALKSWNGSYLSTFETWSWSALSGDQIKLNGKTYRCEIKPWTNGINTTYLGLINVENGMCEFNLGKM